ncbi:hypothetical protein [Psychrobacter cryohalolentis]|uniref:pEK499-p136 HEPN domain-containing protein n=1 Tax=Psychrobacter cryohalolentis (strain ATCC BAA-1226 / DSM 17306 / VKM B-2378 / K5) TaxID=335284 RepID=Q1QDB5_PSYCK|nr:hypothetical protein [Psychrobacter cryohalolentis]ABE74338.1 hypothetical protein Pcryo_0555 [Psychrobacter cryohalolentis K5]ASE26969.1 hypothetical protein CEP87_10395 [Psychrobacter cryohalolentis]
MSKLINQISIGCAVNAAIINDVMTKEKGTFNDSCIEVPKKHNIISPEPNMAWPFQNASWEAYKLYCMIVVPKELYKLAKDDKYYLDLVKEDVMRNFTIKKQEKSFQESALYHFNSLRNSISHVNYSITDDGSFVMWDHKYRQEAEELWHWHIEINKSDMDLFLGEISRHIFNLYNEIERGLRDSNTYAIITS